MKNPGLTIEATPAGDIAGLVVWKDEVSSRKTSSHDGVREGDGRLQLDQGDVVAAEDTGVSLNVGLFIRDWFIYRMKNGFQLSCTMMSAVPIKAAPSSVSTRLCLPMATLYSLPELLGKRRKAVMRIA